MRGRLAGMCLVVAVSSPAQCGGTLTDRSGFAGVGRAPFEGSEWVFASTDWDPDGPGPLPERLVLGGDFSYAGSVACANLVQIDGSTAACSPIGSGVPGRVRDLAALAGGELVAAGAFVVGSAVIPSLLRWDGLSWAPVGGLLSGQVLAMVAHPDGSLLVAGTITLSAYPTLGAVHRWHNGAWTTLGPPSNALIRCLAVDANGDVWAGGVFTSLGGVPATNLARWDGTQWHAVGWTGGEPMALHAHGANDVFAVDEVSFGGPSLTRVRRRSGSTWVGFGPLLQGSPASVTTRSNGEVWLGGQFAGALGDVGVVRGTGGAWQPAGTFRRGFYVQPSGVNHVRRLASGEVLVGGNFTTVDDVGACGAARHDGTSWRSVVPGTNEQVRRFASGGPGEVFAAGWFDQIDGVAAHHIARWQGGAWSALGSGTDGTCDAIVRRANGDLVVGGRFDAAGGVAAARVASWNGTSWAPLGAGLTGTVEVLAEFDGVVFAAGTDVAPAGGGSSGVCAFVGGSWLDVAPRSGQITALMRRSNGELWLAGLASSGPGGHAAVQRWNGTAWTDVPGLPGSFHGYCLAEAANGTVYVGGFDNYQHPVWQWSGGAWTEVGTGLGGSIGALQFLPDGRLLAWGGATLGGYTAASAVWNGVAWSHWGSAGPFGVGTFLDGARELWLASPSTSWNGTLAVGFARVQADCPALVASYGAGCGFGGGANLALHADSGAWLGGVLRSVTTGGPASAPAIGLYGWQPFAMPLGVVLPWAAPGCSLLVVPLVVVSGTSTAAGTSFALAVPADPALVGVALHHQAFAVAGAGGSAVGLTSNGLRCTIGSW